MAVPAFMTFAMLMPAAISPMVAALVMAALHIRDVSKISCEQRLYSRVRVSGHTAVQPDSCRRERVLRASSDSAADQRVRLQRVQDLRQRPVALSVRADHLGGDDLPILHIVNLKLLRMAKVLKNLSVFISNCNFYDIRSFSFHTASIIVSFVAYVKNYRLV